jgi:hypothetical protein
VSNEVETSGSRQPRRGPFGMQRRHFIIVRVALIVGILLLGATLHHRGTAYVAIRIAYFVVIVALVVWRIGDRRRRRRSNVDSNLNP